MLRAGLLANSGRFLHHGAVGTHQTSVTWPCLKQVRTRSRLDIGVADARDRLPTGSKNVKFMATSKLDWTTFS